MDEKLAFHKGALSVLIKEREQIAKMKQVVDQLIQMHIDGMKEQGYDFRLNERKLEEVLE
ncbi:hypothetical protein JW968_05930 [Candidatus Woesearchaeota archaeon]|nr:hypothetical protein [Candidatus Woesearchaeota archaeon]